MGREVDQRDWPPKRSWGRELQERSRAAEGRTLRMPLTLGCPRVRADARVPDTRRHGTVSLEKVSLGVVVCGGDTLSAGLQNGTLKDAHRVPHTLL